jgi:phosphopantetheine adenylyltransferase
MNEPNLFEEMLTTYPAEKRELARAVYHRFADGDNTQFFSQLFLVLDVYAHYAERIPARMISANADSLATAEEIRGEITHIARAIKERDVNITNHAEQTDELCRLTQARCNEAVAKIESLVKNLGTQVDTKAIVRGIQAALDSGIKSDIIWSFIQHSNELGKQVLPALKEIKEVSIEAHTLWRQHIWKTAWAGSLLVTFTLFTVVTTGIYDAFDHYAERKDAEKIAYAERLMNYNQAAFRELAIAQVPIKVLRTESNGVINPQSFALVVEGADSVETRDEDGHKNGYIFFTSHLSEEQIQLLQQDTANLAQPTGSGAK